LICDECQKRPVKVHITRIVNGQKTKLNLCEECAGKYQKFFTPPNIGQNFSITKFLAGLLDDDLGGEVPFQPQTEISCPKCGLSYDDFSVHGRLGCGECYETFKTRIGPLLDKIHGNNKHVGKTPLHALRGDIGIKDSQDPLETKLNGLRSKLQELVEEERFEEAAAVRDEIRELEAQIEGAS
jgi:protein arginine kinase activator